MPADAPLDEGLVAAEPERRAEILGSLLARHRPRLVRMVRMRMHPQVRARLDASDVIQEAYLEAADRIEEYVGDPQMPFFLWLRRMAGQRLLKAHRFHLDAQRRDARRQTREPEAAMPDASVVAMVDLLATDATSPTRAVARSELRAQVAAMLEELDETDREVLCMRHFEELTNDEVALELGLGKHAASKRYIRALRRLRALVGEAEEKDV